MGKQRNVFLFGAGSVLSWENAPSTNCLTDVVRKAGFLIADQSATITDYLYNQLLGTVEEERTIFTEHVNFETIIYAIEELIVHYSGFKDGYNSPINEKRYPSFHKRLFSAKVENRIFKYKDEKPECKKIKNNGLSDIDFNGSKIRTKKEQKRDETDEQYILQILLDEVLLEIYKKISKYAYQNTDVEKSQFLSNNNRTINGMFTDWLNKVKGNDTVIRMYSLNYDRIFKTLLELDTRRVWHIKDGFKAAEVCSSSEQRSVDLRMLYTDFESDSFFNLHGSAYWDVSHISNGGLNSYDITSSPWIQLTINSSQISTIEIEKGRSFAPSPIITGYQKSEKLVLTPFRQMYAAFDKDCFLADNIYIIGYSLGDEHINEALRTAFKSTEATFHIVDPLYKDNSERGNNARGKLVFTLFPNVAPEDIKPTGEGKYDKWLSGRVRIYNQTFKEFLKCEINSG